MTGNPFDAETWAQLPAFLERLPEPVRLTLWGDPGASWAEQEAARLCHTLATEFATLEYRLLPRRANYPYYPVIGVMGLAETQGAAASRPSDTPSPADQTALDFGVRIIGLPWGTQMTALVAAIQVVAFRAQTLEPLTRIKLRRLEQRLPEETTIEILTTAAAEDSALVAKHAFGLAVACPRIRTLLIMADAFPEAAVRYSARHFPHTVINGRFHISGVVNEEALLAAVRDAVSGEQ
jgi:hypothetical protein